jgi:3-methyladenine DNA glycosylase AlkD
MAAAPSPVTAASQRFVADHLSAATTLGERLATLIGDATTFTSALSEGFAALADPAYADGIRSVTPGLGPVFGVRQSLMTAAHGAFKRGTKRTSSAQLLHCVDRLLGQERREMRWFGIWELRRLLPTDPEQSWQLLRRAAGDADEWITVDTLARPYAEGILRDPRRWPEIERLVNSPSRWERRLVGSTLATIPFARSLPGSRDRAVAERGLMAIGLLIGDREPDVQKALSWALRSLVLADAPAVARFAEQQARGARATDDGHRAWVIRDMLARLPDTTAAALRAELNGIRRRPGAPSTSRAATAARIAPEE